MKTMVPIEYAIGIATIITCVVVGCAATLKQVLSVAFADIAYFINRLVFKVGLAHAGMVPKSVKFKLDDKIVCAHYLEREARTTSQSRESSARRDILVLPGFTAEATIMAQLIPAMNLPPEVRVCIMELPLHGKNISNFDGKTFPKPQDTVDYALAFVEAVGLGKNNDTKVPLNLFGYSWGGGMCFQMLAQQPPGTYQRAVLLAPALKDTMDDTFYKISVQDPKKVHGWETLEECKDFFTKTTGGFYLKKLPYVVLAGTHRQRELTYAPYDKKFFTNYFHGLHGAEFKLKLDEAKQKLQAHHKTPVLVACGDRDNCISSIKCKKFVKDFDDRYFSFHEILDTGHVGGPADRIVMTTVLHMVGPVAAEFLFK